MELNCLVQNREDETYEEYKLNIMNIMNIKNTVKEKIVKYIGLCSLNEIKSNSLSKNKNKFIMFNKN